MNDELGRRLLDLLGIVGYLMQKLIPPPNSGVTFLENYSSIFVWGGVPGKRKSDVPRKKKFRLKILLFH